jgi:uncharacterized protein (DUF1501 family)
MKPISSPHILTRRSFMSRAVCTGIGASAMGNAIRDLRLVNTAMAAQGPVAGYKALVCVFLGGGNDANNWIVPSDNTTYNEYAAARGGLLTLPKSSLLSMNVGGSPVADADGHTYGFHPGCSKLQTLFGEGKLATIMNVGTLVRPTTKAQYNANAAFYRPPQLFSHSDQVTQWQTSIPDQAPTTGWGGRVADLIDAVANPLKSISMSVSVAGSNTFEVGKTVSQYHVSTTGAVTMTGNLMSGNGARVRALRDILGLSHANLQRNAYADVLDRAIASGDLLNTAIAPTVLDTFWTTPFPNTTLGNQLKMVARMIQARGNPVAPAVADKFNMGRQIFFVTLGGFDTHTQQVRITAGNGAGTVDDPTNASGAHYGLLNQVSEAMFAFQRAMVQLGVDNNVTQFTASDFSRTFPNNSQGSDHGWGSNHVMVGGAVNGGKIYGKLPTLAINGPDDTGTGRWIPTTAVDQHSWTLAKWFGVSDSEKNILFPNLSRFAAPDLGFML